MLFFYFFIFYNPLILTDIYGKKSGCKKRNYLVSPQIILLLI